MTEIAVPQLDVWKSDFGLPTIDVDCLCIWAYAKFYNIPLHIKISNNPFWSPSGQLPVLRIDGQNICSVNEILQYFNSNRYKSESFLSAKQEAESEAYKSFIEENLKPAIQYICWLDQRNLNEVIKPWYTKAIPFPFNYYYPGKFETQISSAINTLYTDSQQMENEIHSKAQKCITGLSTRLGESEYFFGPQPTVLDAVVFAHLAPLLKIPLPSCALQNHLKACDNLVRFINKILLKYFKNCYEEFEQKSSNENTKKNTSSYDNDFPHKRRDQILAGIVAFVAMTGYALSTGIVQVEDSEGLDSYSYDFDGDEEGEADGD